MEAWAKPKELKCNGNEAVRPGDKDVYVQLVISLSLGLSAFVLFCFLRPRWPTLYAARKRHSDPQVNLPTLPDSFLGWMPALWRVTEAQVLASAGLDAYVFLSFFKMAMRLFVIMFFFAATVLWPINHTFEPVEPPHKNGSHSHNHGLSTYSDFYPRPLSRALPLNMYDEADDGNHIEEGWLHMNKPYLWSYLAFTWFFALLTMYYLNKETFKIIKVRQDYLGTQSTITDRTFRLTGIPRDLRSEAKIKEFVENLEIGRVKSVTLCRNWAEIDGLMIERDAMLRKLEEAWSVYMNKSPTLGTARSRYNGEDSGLGTYSDEHGTGESNSLLAGDGLRNLAESRPRPTTRIRFGFLKFRSRQTDAIDYYEEQLRLLDEKVRVARKKVYNPTATAFVTMDSIAACQMAIQAVIDPRPGQFLSKPAPAPSDVVWKNTYAPMWRRRLQAWTVTIFITVLSLVWIIPVASVAGFISVCTIQKVSPSLAEFLLEHKITQALVQTALPVGVVSLLNVLVPYLYDYLANQQGMISQGDVELSVVSKNFFFTFFNVFVVFTVFGSAAGFWPVLRESFQNTQYIAVTLAKSIQTLSNFYLNFIMLQGIGLFPFRLLQFGSVSLYPIYRWGAKTPRDFAEIVQPTLFNYGFYLPTSLLVFILCLVYSVLPNCQLVLFLGLCYFTLGYYAHKYQLLYSMDQSQHATGGAWRIISYRIILGLCIFEVVMGGILLLRGALYGAALVAPLLVFTIWFAYYFSQRYTPLTVFISLRSIKRDVDPSGEGNPGQDPTQQPSQMRLTRRMSTIDEDKEKGMQFINPSLVAPLEQPWVYQDPPPPLSPEDSIQIPYSDNPDDLGDEGEITPTAPPSENGFGPPGPPGPPRSESNSSSFSLGDTHIWRDNGDDNV